ncbi:MAG: hypothetical protein MZV70_06295 [Desulfobacterales bacterium]|nr:hypothetical protein [Desulfobacterales bacterium]
MLFRLKSAGAARGIFTPRRRPSCCTRLTGGIPLRINNLCDRCAADRGHAQRAAGGQPHHAAMPSRTWENEHAPSFADWIPTEPPARRSRRATGSSRRAAAAGCSRLRPEPPSTRRRRAAARPKARPPARRRWPSSSPTWTTTAASIS